MRRAESLVFLGACVVAAVLALDARDAHACGPDFPHQLLRDRAATMRDLVDGSFEWEAMHLVPPPKQPMVVVEWGDDTHARAQGGSTERTLYDEGAAHYRAGDLTAAAKKWRALLALPRSERIHRSTWAAFMLGKITRDAKWFTLTRTLARDGFHDALGLGVASLGEEARTHLDAGEIPRAVALYAEQASHGSGTGSTSLLLVARRLVNDEAELARAARDPLVRKLVAAYLYTRSNEIDGAWDGKHIEKLQRLTTVLERLSKRASSKTNNDGTDRLAAAAYRAAQWELAARLAKLAPDDSALALWVRAKLALRDGRLDEGRALLARSSASVSGDIDWGAHRTESGEYESLAPRARIDGERAVLALQDRDYAGALTLLLSKDDRYWADAAYVAERVLSVDELVAYVEQHAPQYIPVYESCWGNVPPPPTNMLRAVLARRLMRAGRTDDALRFFDDEALRAKARAYGALMVRGRSAHEDRFERARALWAASRMTREDGMELIGYELDPDWTYHGGTFDLGDEPEWDDDGNLIVKKERRDVLVPKPAFSTYDEQLRVMSSSARPLARFHYRVVAADLAEEAANLLPPRSQAFAAALCEGAAHAGSLHHERARALYVRYVNEGASVDFATHFGSDCPAPDFDSARMRYDDDNRLRPEFKPAPPPKPVRKRDVARDAAVLLGIALATHALARALTRARAKHGAGLP